MLFQSSGRFLYNTIQSSSSFILYEKLPFVVEMVFVYRVKTSINFSIKMLLNIHMMVSYTNNLWFVIERRNGRADKKFKVFYLGFHTWLNFFEYLYIVKQYMIIFHNNLHHEPSVIRVWLQYFLMLELIVSFLIWNQSTFLFLQKIPNYTNKRITARQW